MFLEEKGINSYYALGKESKPYEVISGSYSWKNGTTTINYKGTSYNDPSAYSGSGADIEKINIKSYISNWSEFSDCVVSVSSIYTPDSNSYTWYTASYDNSTGIITIGVRIMNSTNSWRCVLY